MTPAVKVHSSLQRVALALVDGAAPGPESAIAARWRPSASSRLPAAGSWNWIHTSASCSRGRRAIKSGGNRLSHCAFHGGGSA
jgi:hypothetical protein